jgi:cation:H+ antiporter
VSAFICVLQVKSALLLRDLPILLISTVVFSAMLWNGVIGRGEGIALFTGILAYTIFQLVLAKKEKNPEVLAEFMEEYDPAAANEKAVWKLVVAILGGLLALYFGALWLEKGGVSLARTFGVPEAVISLTLIAFSTSVPELATSIVASLKKEGDIITGNIIGSCIFNLLCVIGATAMLGPIAAVQIEIVDLYVMIVMTVLLIPVMGVKRRISRWEGSMLLACYAGYTIFLWFDRVAA